MRYLSLFSGVEAASLAWGPLGWEPMAFAEIDPFPCAVLEHRFPDVPNLGDVSEIDWSDFVGSCGKPDVVVGGSPCQSFSIAGSRTGLKGASGLMFEYIRAVRELLPTCFLWENVPGALSVEGGGRLSDSCCQKWMTSGTVWHGEFLTRNSSEFPSSAAVCSLSECLETRNVPRRYFLSERACLGILSRAERRGKSLPPELEAALIAQARSASLGTSSEGRTPTEATS